MIQSEEQQRIYLDNSASTMLDQRVHEVMEPYWHTVYGNAGGLHREARHAKKAIDGARTKVATALACQADEVIFTSGGTEANNLAVVGLYKKFVRNGRRPEDIHLVTSAIEHSSVHDCFRALAELGVQVSYVPVDSQGRVDPEMVVRACNEHTVLVSLMYVSNEIGSIEPLREIKRALRASHTQGEQPLLHTDASQAPAWLSCNVHSLGVDLMTLDAQKVYGPKGAGCLFRKKGVLLEPVLYGGNQEFGLRPGTPPTPLIVGFAEALALCETERSTYVPQITALRDEFMREVREAVPHAELNGPEGDARLANNVNLSFPGLDGERVVVELDVHGVAASTRSACLIGEAPGSYVVRALGKGEEVARGAVRFTLSRYSTKDEVTRAARTLCDIVTRLYNETDEQRLATN